MELNLKSITKDTEESQTLKCTYVFKYHINKTGSLTGN